MENYFDLLENNPLFQNIKKEDLSSMLSFLSAEVKSFAKDTYIFLAHTSFSAVGIILTGNVHIIQEDYWGNRSILTHIAPPDLFGEAFACAEMEKTPVSALAVEKTDVLFIDYQKIITICPSACVFHGQLIENMLRILAEKNILLTQKMEILSKRTTKEKLLAYLSFQAIAAKSSSFYIPFQRQALADYLGVDRSAMSSALGALKKEGKIDFEKNWFRLF